MSDRTTVPIDSVPCDAGGGECHLCGDEAVVGRVVELDEQGRTALVAFAKGSATVAMDLVDAGVGDDVLVHLGFAIERAAPRATGSCVITREHRDRGICSS
jgi:hydrogenase maturation factor